MIINHLHQNVFRVTPMVELLGGRRAYDPDLMRLSVRQGLEFIARYDDRDSIIVCSNNGADGRYVEILPVEDRQRLQIIQHCVVGEHTMDYLINAYRDPYAPLETWGLTEDSEPLHLISIDGLPILAVYRIR